MKKIVLSTLFVLSFAFIFYGNPAAYAEVSVPKDRFIVTVRSSAEYDTLRAEVTKLGGLVVNDLREIKSFAVVASEGLKSRIAADPRAAEVARDGIRRLIRPEMGEEFFRSGQAPQTLVNGAAALPPAIAGSEGDPAFLLPGLLWNVERINAPQTWSFTAGRPVITVGVADTGLDYTHFELATNVTEVVDLTAGEDPPLCETYFGFGDDFLAGMMGAPSSDLDFNGHGTWIGGNIAALMNGSGINGIAPNISLVGIKISQWCGSAYDSTILSAFLYAARNRVDIVSISFGGYTDQSDPEQAAIYRKYVAVVEYARSKGTVIVASAGNDHVRIGNNGRVMSYGSLTTPGGSVTDLHGMYETPAGIPGVVMVSATGNAVNSASESCPPGTTDTNATCKPSSDLHQPFGVGRENQLAYYSNYGPRVDVAAPGGARKFNLPLSDRGGTPGFPFTFDDGSSAWETFSTTSNWATQIPCIMFLGWTEFPDLQCYSTIQGTSMATPHVAAVLALIASSHPDLQNDPDGLIAFMKDTVQRVRGNATPPLDPFDTTPGDLTGIPCDTGYCHLGGSPIPDGEAYGAGLVDTRLMTLR
ncbi:MAG: S8 family serine peptidase [Nitrospirae bacterium]|nr:S8 family serine peptidase [Nitrospirota bacterium]